MIEGVEDKVLQYGQWLGFDANRYPCLVSVLKEGLHAPLPAGWVIKFSHDPLDPIPLFHDTTTGVYLKDHPLDDKYKQRCSLLVAEVESSNENLVVSSPAIAVQASVIRTSGEQRDATFSSREALVARSDDNPQNDREVKDVEDLDLGPESDLLKRAQEMHRQKHHVINVNMKDIPLTPEAVELIGYKSRERQEQQIQVQHDAVVTKLVRILKQQDEVKHDKGKIEELQRQVFDLTQERGVLTQKLEGAHNEMRSIRLVVPSEFMCPITGEVMEQPVVTADGFTYEKVSIARWLKKHDTSPCTNLLLEHKNLVPNLAIRSQIQDYWQRLALGHV